MLLELSWIGEPRGKETVWSVKKCRGNCRNREYAMVFRWQGGGRHGWGRGCVPA